MNQFLVGERVERKMDGLVGVVKEISTFQGEFSYKVDLGRPPMEGQKDDCWWGTEEAWRRHRRIHAHVETESRDCDGRYTKGYVDVLTTVERCSEFGDLEFKERVMCSVVSLHSPGVLTVTEDGLTWEQPTEEGFSNAEVTWCERDDCDKASFQRDHSAEAAGY